MDGHAPQGHGARPRAVDSAHSSASLPKDLKKSSAGLAVDETRVLGADASEPARRGVALQVSVHVGPLVHGELPLLAQPSRKLGRAREEARLLLCDR